jgi:tetratricopeptide (TPR) repeat protein
LQLWLHDVWWLAPQTDASSLYRPLSVLSYTLGRALGAGPGFERLISLALHLLAVGLVATVAITLGASRRAGWLAAAILGVHPGASEAVAWISARHDLLGSVIVLGGWLALVRGREVPAGLLLGLAAFAKEAFLLTPLTVVIWSVALRRRSWTALALSTTGVLACLVLRTLIDVPMPTAGNSLGELLGAAGGVALRGFELALVPGSADAAALLEPSVWIAAAALVAALCLVSRLPGRPILAALVAPLPLLAPAAAASTQYGVVGDRYFYCLFCGAAIALALALTPLLRAHRQASLLWAVVPALALGTVARVTDWTSSVAIFEASVQRDPANAHAAFHLAYSLHVYERECGRAIPLYEKGLGADPRSSGNLLACLLEVGDLERVVEIGPALAERFADNPTAASNTARGYLRNGDLAPADRWAREAIQRDPERASSWALLGGVLGSGQHHTAAREAFLHALELDASNADARQGLRVVERHIATAKPARPGDD